MAEGCSYCELKGCPRCYGTGLNTRLNTQDEKCQECKGTGACKNCGTVGADLDLWDNFCEWIGGLLRRR